MEKEIKRKKLTLSVPGDSKKPQKKIEIAKAQNRNSTIVEKKILDLANHLANHLINLLIAKVQIIRLCLIKI